MSHGVSLCILRSGNSEMRPDAEVAQAALRRRQLRDRESAQYRESAAERAVGVGLHLRRDLDRLRLGSLAHHSNRAANTPQPRGLPQPARCPPDATR
jgi:hypothetical protein